MTTAGEVTLRIRTSIAIAIVALILLGGSALRLYGLTFQSLWLDELFSMVFSRSDLPFKDIVRVYLDDVHPLGYPFLLHLWLLLFGDTDLAGRSLSAALGILGIAVMLLTGRRLISTEAGIYAALLTALNAYHIAYSQEARMYTLVFMLAALSYGALVSLLHQPGWRTAVSYGLVTAAAAHVHYYALVMLLGQVVAAATVLIARRARWRDWLPLLAGSAIVGLAVLPWLGAVRRVLAMDEYWPTPPKPWFFIDYFHAYFGRSLILSLLFGVLLAAVPFLVSRRPGVDRQAGAPPPATVAWLLAASVVVSLAAAFARSVLIVPMLQPRFTIVFLPAILLLIAIALARLRPRPLRALVAAGLTVLSLAGLLRSGYYTEARKEQWREAVDCMLTDPRFDVRTDACLAVLAPGFQYYVDQRSAALRIGEATVEALQGMVDDGPAPPVLWLLVARNQDPAEEFRRLQRQHYLRTDQFVFLKTAVERWELRAQPEPDGGGEATR